MDDHLRRVFLVVFVNLTMLHVASGSERKAPSC